jgi:probable DNA metabolism protein
VTTAAPIRIALAHETDFAGFRDAARDLVWRRVPPERIAWQVDSGDPDLFAQGSSQTGKPRVAETVDGDLQAPIPTVPRAFVDCAAKAALHRDRDRFALLYRLLYRLQDEPRLMALASDPDVARLTALAKAVRRDIHKMHAFVRFRAIEDEGREVFIAWYEPDHHIVEAAAPFFVQRFAALRWSILTPELSLLWRDGALLRAPGTHRAAAPVGDGLEELWRSYYASIFNPARVNPEAMRAEMPKRFWRNLPEAALIPDLVSRAPRRARTMIEAPPTRPVQRRGHDRDLARAATESPADALAACRACPLWEHATQSVAGEGPPGARLMLVGEQPGDAEDIAGRPFVGPAGRLLDAALARAGVDRASVYVTNAVKHFKYEPRGRRRIHKRPGAREIAACRPWLEQELASIRPKMVLLLGASAAQAVLGRSLPVTRMRGTVTSLADGTPAMVTTHPAYILRLPGEAQKSCAFDDLVRDLAEAAALADGATARP